MPGGLSNLKKTININGQPHSLAWINPGEASALKAMGGSGKKVDGIPAYFDEWSFAETAEDLKGPSPTTQSYDDTYVQGLGFGGDPAYADERFDPTPTPEPTVDPYTYYQGVTSRGPTTTPTQPSEEATVYPAKGSVADTHRDDSDDRQTRLNTAKQIAYARWRNSSAGRHSLNPSEDYNKWFNAQDPDALIAGLSDWRGPAGMAMQSKFNLVNNQLKEMFAQRASQKSEVTDEELTREELSAIVESAKVKGLEDFTPYSGLDYPIWAPGGMLAAGMNLLSRTVIGTGTVGGVGVHLHKDGSVTVISPEDTPGYDYESLRGENVEPIDRRKQRGGFGYTQEDVEKLQEEPLTGIASLQDKRPKVASVSQSRQAQFNNIASIFGREEAANMLNLPENIFA